MLRRQSHSRYERSDNSSHSDISELTYTHGGFSVNFFHSLTMGFAKSGDNVWCVNKIFHHSRIHLFGSTLRLLTYTLPRNNRYFANIFSSLASPNLVWVMSSRFSQYMWRFSMVGYLEARTDDFDNIWQADFMHAGRLY